MQTNCQDIIFTDMKNLILALILESSLLGFSQIRHDIIMPNNWFSDFDTIMVDNNFHISKAMLISYSLKCFNDSSKQCYLIYNVLGGSTNNEIKSCDYISPSYTQWDSTSKDGQEWYHEVPIYILKVRYIHREPTLQGFIDFISK